MYGVRFWQALSAVDSSTNLEELGSELARYRSRNKRTTEHTAKLVVDGWVGQGAAHGAAAIICDKVGIVMCEIIVARMRAYISLNRSLQYCRSIKYPLLGYLRAVPRPTELPQIDGSVTVRRQPLRWTSFKMALS